MFLDRVILFGGNRRSYPFLGNFGRSGKGSFTDKTKIVNRVLLCVARESACSKLQYDPDLISVVCPKTELSISGKFWEIRYRVVHRKIKNVDNSSLCIARERTCSMLQYDHDLISVACSETKLSILV